MEDELWERFGEVAEPDRSTVLRDFVRWYLREPKVTLPKRPEAALIARATGAPAHIELD
jgi:hypothetical protein